MYYLPYVTMAYNFSPNAITGLSPFEIMFGRTPSFPLPNPERTVPKPSLHAVSDHYLAMRNAMLEGYEHT